MIMHSSRSLVLAAVALAAATLGTGSAKAEFSTVISDGHVDLNGFLDQGTLKMNIRTGATSFFDPSTTLVLISESIVRPTSGFGSSADYDFLGVDPGETLWVSPQNIGTSPFGGVEVPEMGFRNSYRTADGGVNPMVFEFDRASFSGPGRFSVFTDIGALFMSSDVDAQDFVNVSTHSHFNWGFTEAGMYSVTLRARGTNQAGQELIGEWTTFNIQAGSTSLPPGVIPEPSSIVMVSLGAGIFGVALRRRVRRQPADQA